ncbi:MAG: tetratricopeptide repeat protein [bacterium]
MSYKFKQNLLLILFLSYIICFTPVSKAQEWSIPDFSLNESIIHHDDNTADRVLILEDEISNLTNTLADFAGKNILDNQEERLLIYLENNTTYDFVITDIIANLDNVTSHFNFSDKKELLTKNTTQKFYLENITPGNHELRLTFLLFKPNDSAIGNINKLKNPISPCRHLTDAHCLHKTAKGDPRIKNQCNLEFYYNNEQDLNARVSFKEGGTCEAKLIAPESEILPDLEYKSARGHFLNQNYFLSLCILNHLKESDYLSEKILFLRGEAYLKLQLYKQAASCYRSIIDTNTFENNDIYALSLIKVGMIHMLTKDYGKAITYFQKLPKTTNPEIMSEAQFLTALSYYNLQEFEKFSSLDKPLLHPIPFQYLKALVAISQKKFSKAAHDLSELPNDPNQLFILPLTREFLSPKQIIEDSQFYCAKVLYRQNNYEEAEKRFSLISETSAHYKDALIGKGMILLRQNRIEELSALLKELVDKYMEVYFTSDARFAIANNLKMTGDFDQAYQQYEKALSVCQSGIEYLNTIEATLEDKDKFLLLLKGLKTDFKNDSRISSLTNKLERIQKLEATVNALRYGMFGAKPNQMMRIGLIHYLLESNIFDKYTDLITIQQENIDKNKDFIASQLIESIKDKVSTIKTSYREIINRGKLEIALAQSTKDSRADSPVLDQIIMAYENYLSEYPDSAYNDKITFQLAEIYYQKAILDFQRSLEDKDSKGDPRPNFDAAIALYGKMLWKFPESIYLDKALYALGYAYYEQGTIILAKNAFRHLLNRYPESSLAPEVLLRLAEIFFDENDFANATKLYQNALKGGEFPEQYSNYLLYKLAWSYYKEDNYEQSFAAFISLLDQYLKKSGDLALAEEIKNQLSRILTDFIDISFILEYLAKITDKPYHVDLMYAVAHSLFNEGRFQDAIAVSQATIDTYPLFANTPLLYAMIENCHLKQNDPEKANRAREDLIKNYGENSPWWSENKDEEQRQLAFSLIDEAIKNTTFYLLQKKDESNYRHLISLYRDNQYSPTNEAQINTLNFYLAECLFKTKQYTQALEEYKKLLNNKENNKYYEEAAYKMILALEKIILAGYRLRRHEKESPLSKEEIEFIASCDRIKENFPNHKYIAEILYKKGELLYNKKRYEDAIPSLQYIIEHYPQSTVYRSALKIAAHANFQNGDYHTAACEFQQLVNLCDSLLKEKGHKVKFFHTRQESHKMLVFSRYKKAEQSGNAEEFRRIAEEFPNAQVADVALYEAASMYQKENDYKKAKDVYHYLVKNYPKSPHAPASLWQIAAFYEKENDFLKAAESYENLFHSYPKFEGALNSLYKAGFLYEKLTNWNKEEEMFRLYLSKNPKDRLIEAIFRKGYAQKEQGKADEAHRSFQIAADTYNSLDKKTPGIEAYFAARSQFNLAEIYLIQYNNIKIKDLSDESTKRKLTLLSELIKSFNKVCEYKVAEWTTNATYTIALAIEDLSEDLLSIKEAKASDSEYLNTIKLKQKIADYIKNSISFYKKNIELAIAHSVENEWIEKSREKVAMNIARWGNLYEQIASLIQNAPIPSVLNEAEQKQYKNALAAKAQSFIKQAVEAYENNTNAYKWKIRDNAHVIESYKRLSKLWPTRYNREAAEIIHIPDIIENLPDHLYME